MIAEKLRHAALVCPDRPAVREAAGVYSFGDLDAFCVRQRVEWSQMRGARIAHCCPPSARAIAALTALDELGCQVFLAGPRTPEQCRQLASMFFLPYSLHSSERQDIVVESHAVDQNAGQSAAGSVTILTSGTTGTPKAAVHTWETLARPSRVQNQFEGTVWLLTYPLHLYAGLQVFLQTFLNRGTLVIPKSNTPAEVLTALREGYVEYASGTPSFWRNLLLFADSAALRQLPVRQITMGGEIATQDLLDRLAAVFPDARIVHVYATTELGRCFSVTDGRSGFPARFLDQVSEDGVCLRIRDGMLEVRSANAMQGYDRYSAVQGDAREWFRTGDLVRQEGNRIFFLGRQSDIINVGGHKVLPSSVEEFLCRVPGVAAARVYSKRNAITGELVAADIVLAAGVSEPEVKQCIAAGASTELEAFARPRILRFVPELDMTAAGKITRCQE